MKNRLQGLAVLALFTISPLFGQSGTELKTGALNASKQCGECHQAIYIMWQRSIHSAAFTDPIFEASYLMAYRETGGEAREVCLRCHAPLAVLTGDLEAKESLSREGITCDYCHSVASVDLERRDQPFRLDLEGVKYGPLADAESPVHPVARSEHHKSSEFCAGCHEYQNAAGVAVFSTYSEWKKSPQAAEGRTCQSCHMPLTPGQTVLPGLGTKTRENINLHNISGMHSAEQVRKAATAKVLRLERERPNTAVVEVEVANVGSGHSIPTGLPTRKLILEVTVFSEGREVRRFQKQYAKTLLDSSGRIIREDHATVLAAHSLKEDTRLEPGERRVERFHAPVPKKGRLSAEAELRYLYEPRILSREKISIEMATDRSP